MIVSAGDYQALWQQPIRASFVDQNQVAKGEWHKTWRRLRDLFDLWLDVDPTEQSFHLPARDRQAAFGFSLLRDTTNGRPPYIWVRDPAEVNDPDLQSAHVEIAAAGLIAHGNVADAYRSLRQGYAEAGRDAGSALAAAWSDPNAARPAAVRAYASAHETFHPALEGLREQYGWANVHLVDGARGKIVYSAIQEPGTFRSITDGAVQASPLGRSIKSAKGAPAGCGPAISPKRPG